MPTHYDTLGVDPGASPAQVRSAYRRLARTLHPDVNPSADAHQEFLHVQEAYEVLSDPKRRAAYDGVLEMRAERESKEQHAEKERDTAARRRLKEQLEAEELRLKAEARMREAPPKPRVDPSQTERLTSLLDSGKLADAERLARQMLESEARQPVPYAVLGDIARFRGEFATAMRFYGLAAQYEPANTVYQRKYEELLHDQSVSPPSRATFEQGRLPNAVGIGAFLVLSMAVYTALSPERPIGVAIAPAWTVGIVVMLFLAGVSAGACATASGTLGRFRSVTGSAVSRFRPGLFVSVLSIGSFWLACLVYVAVGHTQQAFSRSISALLALNGAVVALFALVQWGKSWELAVQTLFWGGNVSYFGSLAGWWVADAFQAVSARPGD